MINTLPKSLIESAHKVLTEAVALKAHIDLAKKASKSTKENGMTRAENISSHVIPMGTDSVTIPLERDVVEPHPDVESHLNDHGYDVFDYKKGLAVKSGETKNPTSIGKVLQRTNAPQSLKTTYEKDPNRQGLDSRAKIVISRNPIHVAGMSTHQNWESCQTLGGGGKYTDEHGQEKNLNKQEVGSERKYVSGDIAAGSHIAYLVHHEDDVNKHYAPISRILLKPYESKEGHTILRPSAVYGEEWGGFHDSVSKWAEKHFPVKDAEYTQHSEVYPEGNPSYKNYAPEHDEYWKNKGARATHPSSSVIDHYITHLDDPIPGLNKDSQYRTKTMYDLNDLASNPHLKEHHVNAMLNYDTMGNRENFKEKLVLTHPSRTAVEYGLANEKFHEHVAENPSLTEQDIDHLISHNRENLESVNPNIAGGNYSNTHLLVAIGKHPNLSRSQADYLANNTDIANYTESPGHVASKASPDAAKKIISKMQENNSLVQYQKHDFATIAKNRPELIPHFSKMAMYHAYNEIKSPIVRKTIEDNMLSTGKRFHAILARGSNNKDTLTHIIKNTDDENARDIARARLINL